MDAYQLASYLRAVRLTYEIPRLRAIAYELEAREPNDEATQPLLKVIALRVKRIAQTN